jgi:hypothetical protein
MDADIRPVRRDGHQCRSGVTWNRRGYDRKATRRLIWTIRKASHGRVKMILFNDPVLIRAGLTQRYPGHDNHLHVRFCSPTVRLAAYHCR